MSLSIQGKQLKTKGCAHKQSVVNNTLTIDGNGRASKHLDVSPPDTSKSATKTSENTNSIILIEDAFEAKKDTNDLVNVKTGMYS